MTIFLQLELYKILLYTARIAYENTYDMRGFQVSSCRFRPNARSEIYFGNESIYFGQISANTTLHTCASICKPVHFKTLTNQRQACMMLPSSSTVQDVCLLDSKLLRRSFMSAVVFRKHIAVEKLQTKPCHLVRFSRAKILTGLKRAQNDNRFAIESLQDFASYDKNWLCKNLRHAWKTGRKKDARSRHHHSDARRNPRPWC